MVGLSFIPALNTQSFPPFASPAPGLPLFFPLVTTCCSGAPWKAQEGCWGVSRLAVLPGSGSSSPLYPRSGTVSYPQAGKLPRRRCRAQPRVKGFKASAFSLSYPGKGRGDRPADAVKAQRLSPRAREREVWVCTCCGWVWVAFWERGERSDSTGAVRGLWKKCSPISHL